MSLSIELEVIITYTASGVNSKLSNRPSLTLYDVSINSNSGLARLGKVLMLSQESIIDVNIDDSINDKELYTGGIIIVAAKPDNLLTFCAYLIMLKAILKVLSIK